MGFIIKILSNKTNKRGYGPQPPPPTQKKPWPIPQSFSNPTISLAAPHNLTIVDLVYRVHKILLGLVILYATCGKCKWRNFYNTIKDFHIEAKQIILFSHVMQLHQEYKTRLKWVKKYSHVKDINKLPLRNNILVSGWEATHCKKKMKRTQSISMTYI